MTQLPTQYADLPPLAASLPILDEALKLYGTREVAGDGNNPAILSWAKELGGTVARDYRADSVPWCGLFAAIVAHRADFQIPANPLWALNWREFGSAVTEPGLCDVLVFVRAGGGHVGFYVGEDAGAFHVLGGNQGDQVKIMRVERGQLKAARRALYASTPAVVRPITRQATDPTSAAMA